MAFRLDSNFAKSVIHGSGQARLQGDYPVDAKLTFSNVTYAGLQGFLGSQEARPGFDALLEGEIDVKGPTMQPANLQARLQVSQLQLSTLRHSASGNDSRLPILQNQGPIVARMDHSLIRVESARLAGRSTNIDVAGTIALDNRNPFNLTVKANTDLALLKGIFAGHLLRRQCELGCDGAWYLRPAAREREGGVKECVDQSRAVAERNFQCERRDSTQWLERADSDADCGIRGGNLTLSGFVGMAPTLAYNLRANANKVRTRYSGRPSPPMPRSL